MHLELQELSHKERSSYKREVTTANNWVFERGVRSGIGVLIFVLVEFMQRDQFNQQQHNITNYRQTVVNAQCFLRKENYPDARTKCNDAIDNC